jgi:hypothetical protein
MQGNAYTVVRPAVTTSTAITIIQLTVPTTTLAEITRAWVDQSSSTTSTAARIQIVRKTGVATVTSQNPTPLGTNSGASLCVGGVSATGITATVEGTDGNILVDDGFNILNGWLWVPVPEERIVVRPGETIGLKFPSAPTSAAYSAGLNWVEY